MEGFSDRRSEEEKNNSKPGLWEVLMFAVGLFNLAEEEVQGWVRRLTEREDVKPEERSRLFNEVWRRQREATTLIEQWLEERISGVSRTFPTPFQRELKHLQRRMKLLRERVQVLSEKLKGSG